MSVGEHDRPAADGRVHGKRSAFWKRALAALLLAPVLLILAYRFLPVPGTPLMLIRAGEGQRIVTTWLDDDQMPRPVMAAVLTSEDQRFCQHQGFDWVELDKAIASWRQGHRLRGASTISQQTAKNLFLPPWRSVIRKAIEAPLTVALEAMLPKRRILTLYLNIAEWGPGIYGIEAASHHAFGIPARQLDGEQAALLAAVLPDPLARSPSRPSRLVREKAAAIRAGMARGEADLSCLGR